MGIKFSKWPTLCATALVVVGVGAVWLANQSTRNPLDEPAVGFQMYTPRKLPDGFQITDKRISVHSTYFYDKENGDPNKIRDVTLEMNLRHEDWVYAIVQRRAKSDHKAEVTATYTGYDSTSITPSCMNRTSDTGKRYRLCHWVDYGKISVFEVKFIEGDTYIDTTFPTTLQNSIEVSEIDRYVESFEATKPEGIETLVDAI